MGRYLHELMLLRSALWRNIQEVAGEVRGVPALEPAGAAY